jgi:Skp family chaperone for outer membrane proteins
MTPRERIVVYGFLAVLVASNVILLLGSTGPAAVASAPLADDLGPADAVILAGEDGEDLLLRSRDGRLTWGEGVHHRSYSTAYVFIGQILNQLMQSEDRSEARQAIVDELTEEEAEYQERLEAVLARGQELEEGSEEFRRAGEEYMKLAEEFRQWQGQALQRRGKIDAEQLEDAYREMIDAVQVVADGMKIDTVYRFIPSEEPFRAENPEQALMSIRLRPALRYPEELDITAEVLDELSLDVE